MEECTCWFSTDFDIFEHSWLICSPGDFRREIISLCDTGRKLRRGLGSCFQFSAFRRGLERYGAVVPFLPLAFPRKLALLQTRVHAHTSIIGVRLLITATENDALFGSAQKGTGEFWHQKTIIWGMPLHAKARCPLAMPLH